MSNKQQGAALVIVMALLTGAMVVGVAGMQSTLVDERLAGNYRASAQAQMAAEDVAGYIQKNYSRLPKPADIEKKEDGWRFIKLENRYSKKNKSFSLKESYTKCNFIPGNDDCNLVYNYDGDDEDKKWLIGTKLSFPFYIARGQVLEDVREDAVAEHRIVVWHFCIFCDLVGFKGESVIAGEDEDSCGKKNRDNIEGCRILGEDNVPRPDRAIDDFISRYNSDDIPEEKIVKSCDDEFNKNKSVEYVLCMEEDFEGKIDSKFDGLTIIVSGEKDEDDGEVDYDDGNVDDVNIKSSISLNVIASGDIGFIGFGGNTLTGNFWSGDGVKFNGRTNIVGGVVAVEDVEFNGKANVSGGLKINDESDGSEGGKGGGDIIWFSY